MIATSPVLANEEIRLAAVGDLFQKAARKDADLSLIARGAAQLMETPIGFISLVGQDELTIVGRHGIDVEKVPREIAFCSHTIVGSETFVINDTHADQRFENNPLAQGPNGLRFYAGAPLVDPTTGQTVGAVCVADFKPREATSDAERNILTNLSRVAADELS